MLVLAVLIFCVLYGILAVRRESSWVREIRAAVAAADAPRAALLLRRCREESPRLAATPALAALEAQTLALQEQSARRAAQFSARVAALSAMLDDGGWRDRAMALEFAEAAKIAPGEPALEELQQLKLRYEALCRKQAAEAALAGARQVGELRQLHRQLEAARRAGDWPAYDRLAARSSDLLAALKPDAAAMPELAGAVREVETALLRETEAAAVVRREASRRRSEFLKVPAGPDAGAIVRNARKFLERYPDTPESMLLQQLLDELKQTEISRRDEIEGELARMNARAQAALGRFRLELLKLDAAWNAEPFYQLTVRRGDRDESFYTPDKAAFTAPDASVRARIAFIDRERRKIAAAFLENGDGELTVDAASAAPVTLMVPDAPRNYLVRARYQAALTAMRRKVEAMTFPEFPAFLGNLAVLTEKSDGEYPAMLREQLAAAVRQAASLLEPGCDPAAGPTAGELHRFRRDFLAECAQNTPVFVGVWHHPADAEGEFFPVNLAYCRGAAWIPKGETKFESVGELRGLRLLPEPGAPAGLHAVFSPAGELALKERRDDWLIRARQIGLTRLPWPAFWPEAGR